ncbi:unnamed protein product [Urochloa humidicola]
MDSSMMLLVSAARASNSMAYLSQWRSQLHLMESSWQSGLANVLAAFVLTFSAAVSSSAAGVGGASLYAAILSAIAGASVETATVFSSFMVALSNAVFLHGAGQGGEPQINYDVAVVSRAAVPATVLLGASVGVLCDAAFPEWLVAAFLPFSRSPRSQRAALGSGGGARRRWP